MKSCPIINSGQDLTSLSQNRSENNLSDHESTNIGYIKRIPPVYKKAKKIAMKGILKGKLLRRGGPSTAPVVDEDISIHTGLPKSSTRISKWPEQHNMVLGELLLEQYLYGNMLNGVLRKDLWVELVKTLNRRLDTTYTVPMVIVRFKNMKADFREVYQLSHSSGWGWDEDRKMPIASDEIWDDLIKVRPKMARFRRNPFRQYDIFEKICGDNIAIGSVATSNHKKKMPIDVEEASVDVANDDFMSGNGVSFINEDDVLETQNGSENFETPEVDISMAPLSGGKRSSEYDSKPPKKNKRQTINANLTNLINHQIESNETFKLSVNRHAPHSMSECLSKLGNIPNISTAAILAVQSALKDSNDNKTTFMSWEGDMLKHWIEHIVSIDPKFHSYDPWN